MQKKYYECFGKTIVINYDMFTEKLMKEFELSLKGYIPSISEIGPKKPDFLLFLKDDCSDSTKYKLVSDFDKVLSLDLTKEDKKEVDEDFINKKIEERNNAKLNKDYELADKIRNELLDMGIVLKDTREGTIYEVR